jgi:hypothetical protein
MSQGHAALDRDQVLKSEKLELWIRIDLTRIRHFSSIRIHKVIESGSDTDPGPQ